jgi:hypothetical protein
MPLQSIDNEFLHDFRYALFPICIGEATSADGHWQVILHGRAQWILPQNQPDKQEAIGVPHNILQLSGRSQGIRLPSPKPAKRSLQNSRSLCDFVICCEPGRVEAQHFWLLVDFPSACTAVIGGQDTPFRSSGLSNSSPQSPDEHRCELALALDKEPHQPFCLLMLG